jgi:hypothetical protein
MRRGDFWFIVVTVALILVVIASEARPQQSCADRSIVTGRLKDKYKETQIGLGLRNETSIFELWVNNETGSWTILQTVPLMAPHSFQSCVMAAGNDWRSASRPVKGDPL